MEMIRRSPDVDQALQILKRDKTRVRSSVRYISGGAVTRVLTIRALEGACGKCSFRDIQYPQGLQGSVVELRCQIWHLVDRSPIELHRNILFDQTPHCPGLD